MGAPGTMYVCLCNSVTDSAIREAVNDGVRTFRELSFRTRCGSRCGSCIPLARSLLQESLSTGKSRASAPELHVVSAA